MRAASAFLFLAALTLSGAHADTWVSPHPRLFSGGNGFVTYGFKVLPEQKSFTAPARGELFRLTATGETPVVWRGVLRNHPLKVYVGPQGHVITLDTYGGDQRGRHALVIYSPEGQVVADLSVAQVAPGDAPIVHTPSGLFLTRVFEGKFVYYDKSYFALRDARGGGPVFDLDTGKPKR